MTSLFDITLVGGGIIGRALALGLATHEQTRHLRIALIDGNTPTPFNPAYYDSRVVALSARSQQFLDGVGAWQDISALRACPYYAMNVWDGDGTGRICFSSDDIHAPQLGHIVESSVIMSSLNTQLQQAQAQANRLRILEGVTVTHFDINNKTATKEGRMHTLQLSDHTTLATKLVVGVDGARSFIREQAGIATRDWSYGHNAIVATVKTQSPHGHTAWQRFTQTGPIALLPLENNGKQDTCSLVWSVDTDKAAQLMALNNADFCAALTRETEHTLGNIEQVDERISVPLHQRHAKRYFNDGVVLVGDAAHVIHPLAGLGANLGFADVSTLITELARASERGLAFDHPQILRRYERQRQGENLAVMAAMEAFKRTFGANNMLVRYARNIGLKQCDQNVMIKKIMTQIMC